MRYIVLSLLFVFLEFPCMAQKKQKPQVLVYGSGMLAFSAAVQSARSNVPTLWVVETDTLVPEFSTKQITVEEHAGLDGGIWLEILMDMALSKSRDDSLALVVKKDMSPRLFLNALDKILHNCPQLTVCRGQKLISLKADKSNWAAVLANKEKFEFRAVVDASKGGDLRTKFVSSPLHVGEIFPIEAISIRELRGLVVSGVMNDGLYAVTLKQLLSGEHAGFFSPIMAQNMLKEETEAVVIQSAMGQALGATAAYVSFFKTTSEKIDVRKLQMELMTYGMRIMPYQDVSLKDKNFYALQRFGLSGILAMDVRAGRCVFDKYEKVKMKDVQPVFNRLYSRSQLWFADNNPEHLIWSDFLALIKFVGLRGNEIDREIERDWSSKFGFEGSFDVKQYVSRYEFAVILDRYASPFLKSVSQNGEFIN
ncbi:hypothetical protein [Sphingobacterium sp. LRF_L2]|uniref:hypothetical protein n=1 Tax=Sphingobacterium sp. LRF_L2 TaxID=3369421 RepID=UPI003F629DF3